MVYLRGKVPDKLNEVLDRRVGPEFPRLSGRVGFLLCLGDLARSIRLWNSNASGSSLNASWLQ